MFDSHCHLHDISILARTDELLKNARAAGVTGFLLAGVEPEGWEIQRELATTHGDVFNAIGIHPQVVAEVAQAKATTDAHSRLNEMLSLLGYTLREKDFARAIGEIGLDAARDRRSSLELQKRVFREQLALARQFNLPVVLHVLDAHGAALEILQQDGLPERAGVVHSCSASADVVREYLRHGLYVSFASPVALPKAAKVHRAAREVPLERLLVETDSPFQTPIVKRPARNEPAFLSIVVDALSQVREQAPELIAEITERNARTLLDLP